jgi:putative salt-induced outer membrane protein
MWAGSAQAEWKFKGELGVVIASGNTETETISAKFDAVNELEKWKHSFGASALRSRDQDGLTGDRYEVHAQSDYKISDRSYVLGSVRYDNDKFSPYSYQAVGAVGYGYKFFDTEATKLAIELGAGYRRTEDRVTKTTEGDGIVRGAMNYAQQLTASTSVFDKFLVEAGSDNTYLQNEVGVLVKMSDQLALSVAHLLRHNTDVNENAVPVPKKTDQLLTVNLVFSF